MSGSYSAAKTMQRILSLNSEVRRSLGTNDQNRGLVVTG